MSVIQGNLDLMQLINANIVLVTAKLVRMVLITVHHVKTYPEFHIICIFKIKLILAFKFALMVFTEIRETMSVSSATVDAVAAMQLETRPVLRAKSTNQMSLTT
jgi:hypothetical protein